MRDFARDAVQHQTFDWLYQLVCALARERPLCLVLEDLHWSDEATLALLDELLPAAEQAAVGFLLVHRSDPDHPAWQLVDRARRRFRHLFLELELEPLPDVGRARARRGGRRRRAARGARAAPRRADRRQPVLRRGGDSRSARARRARAGERPRSCSSARPSIPAAIQEALQARLDRLDAEARELAHDRRRDRALLRPAAARAAPPTGAAATDPLRAPVAPARRRGAERLPRPSTASVTGSCRRSRTARSSRRAGASSTCGWARRSSSSTATRRPRCTGSSPATSPRRTSPSARSSTC